MKDISREEIFEQIKILLVNGFEIDESQISLDSHVFKDLDLDSIDMLIVGMSEKECKQLLAKNNLHVTLLEDHVMKFPPFFKGILLVIQAEKNQ